MSSGYTNPPVSDSECFDEPSSDDVLYTCIPPRDIRYMSPSRQIFHSRMIDIFDRLDSASPEEKDSLFRYFEMVEVESHQTQTGILTHPLNCDCLSLNPLATWYTGITDLILSFLDPLEAISLITLSTHFYQNFWQRCITLTYTDLVLGRPWRRCPLTIRRRIFPRWSGIRTLRIEPSVSRVYDRDDLDDILRRSTGSLERLYICTPCESLLLTNQTPSSRLHPILEESDSSAQLSNETCSVSEFHSFDSRELKLSTRLFTELRHIELTGNDSHRWSEAVLEWSIPNIKSLTLQLWDDNFDKVGIIEKCRSTDREKSFIDDANIETDSNKETPNWNTERRRKRRLVFEALLNKVSGTIWDLEFLVPGWLLDDSGSYSLSQQLNTQFDSPRGKDSNNKELQQSSECRCSVRESMKMQFEDFWKLLQGILFDKTGFKYLRKLEFLGIPNFSFAVRALRTALCAEYYSEGSHGSSSFQVFTADDDGLQSSVENHYPMLDEESQQPILPVLDYLDDFDSYEALRSNSFPSETEMSDHTESQQSTLPLGHSLIVFSGLLQWSYNSCIEFNCLYPLCIQQSSSLKSLSAEERRHNFASGVTTQSSEFFDCPQVSGTIPETIRRRQSDRSTNASESQGVAEQTVMKLRVQHAADVSSQREFQRLQSLERLRSQRYLQPLPRQSQKGKPPSKKKLILAYQESPQDASEVVSKFSESTTNIEIFLANPRDKVRPFSVMRVPRLSSLRLVDWSGANKSHLSLLNFVTVSPARRVHLTIETTATSYPSIRRREPKLFYASLIRFVLFLKARGILIDRIRLFPGPEIQFVANMNYFFPIKRLHVAPPPLHLIQNFEHFNVPYCLFTLFLPINNSIVTIQKDGQESSESLNDDENESSIVPHQLAINSQILEVAEPLERRYSTVREFLVGEVENLTRRLSFNKGNMQPSPFVATVAWKDATSSEREGRLPSDFNSDRLLEHFVKTYAQGTFFSDDLEERNVHLTLSCNLGLVEFYKMIIGLRSLSVCTLTERPFHDARILLQFDSQRYGSLDDAELERGDWLLESILLPWLTLVEIFKGLCYSMSIIVDVPYNSKAIKSLFNTLESHGPGVSVNWIDNRDLAIVVLNPQEWNSFLCQWTLDLADGNIGEVSKSLLKMRAADVQV